MSHGPLPQYGLPQRHVDATFFQNIRLRLVYISLGVLGAHVAALAWLQVGQPEVHPPVVLEPFQTRQILAQPVQAPTPINVARDQPKPPVESAQRERVQPQTSRPVAAPSVSAAVAIPDITALAAPPAVDNAQAEVPGKPQAKSIVTGETPGTTQGAPSRVVTLPSSMADYLSNPPPTYPALSLRLSEQGKVVVRVLIGKNGRALNASLAQSSGFDRLDQAALRAVSNWRYVPGTVDGQAQDMWFDVPVNFKPTR